MVYKIGGLDDLARIPIIAEEAKEYLYHYASVLSVEYGDGRDIDKDLGGYILYVVPGTTDDEIKAYFDYTQNEIDIVDSNGNFCSALYILGDDYGVVIVVSIEDAPYEIKKEINNKGDKI